MARRDESILNLLVEYPWWVSVIVSVAAFVFLRFIFPSIDFGSMAANAFVKGLSGAAPFVALVLLLPAPVAALNSWIKRKHHTGK
jgi:restriction system protein